MKKRKLLTTLEVPVRGLDLTGVGIWDGLFHEGLWLGWGCESELFVQTVRAAGCQHEPTQALKSWVLQRAKDLNLSWPLKLETTDAMLDKIFYPSSVTATLRSLPDCEYIHK